MLQHFLGGSLYDLFTPVAHGREPIAVNQPGGGGTAYPFSAPSDLNPLIADAYLYAIGDNCQFAQPFAIAWLYGFGTQLVWPPVAPAHDQDVLIVDARGRTVFDSTQASEFRTAPWGDRLRVCEWRITAPERVLRLVQHVAVPLDEAPANWPKYYEPEFAEFDPRVIEFARPQLRSLRLPGGQQLRGKLRLVAGHNLRLTPADTVAPAGGRAVTAITCDVAPGDGAGRYAPGCTDTPVLRAINGARPDAQGNLNLSGTACYRIERAIFQQTGPADVVAQDGALQLANDCTACCTCQGFINTYEAIRRLRNRYADLVQRTHAVRDAYQRNLARWNAQKTCREQQALQLLAQPSCNKDVLFAASYCNHTSGCLDNLVVIFSFQYSDEAGDTDPTTGEPLSATTSYSGTSDPSLTCGSSYRAGNAEANPLNTFTRNQPQAYPLNGSYPYFTAVWDRVRPNGLAAVMFSLEFPDSQPQDLVEVVVDVYQVPAEVSRAPGDDAPVPGYVFGAGPLTAEARSYRLGSPRKLSIGLLQNDCCE